MAFDCFNPTLWRNRECRGVPQLPPGEGGDLVEGMGTELDWLGFFYNLTRPEPNTLLNQDLYTIFIAACQRQGHRNFCNPFDSGNIAWEDCAAGTCSRPEFGIHPAMEDFRDQGKVSVATLNRFVQFGRDYGVDRNTAP
jgi:hypothetical protein